MIRLTLPFPVSANRYWRSYRGRMVRSAEANAYKQEVGWLCQAAGVQPLTGDVCVTFDFYRAAKRGDTDNFLKITIDALIGYAYADDRQIVEIHATRHDDKANPRVEVTIECVTQHARQATQKAVGRT